MYHSNQHFDVSGEFENLAMVLQTAINLYQDPNFISGVRRRIHLAWRVTANGKYFCVVDREFVHDLEEGETDHWTDYPPKATLDDVAKHIEQWCLEQPYKFDSDGMEHKGFRCQVLTPAMVDELAADSTDAAAAADEDFEGFENVIACFSPHTCWFAK